MCLHFMFSFVTKRALLCYKKSIKFYGKFGSFIKREAFKFLYSKQKKKYNFRFKDSKFWRIFERHNALRHSSLYKKRQKVTKKLTFICLYCNYCAIK